jgi:hypothetical protein
MASYLEGLGADSQSIFNTSAGLWMADLQTFEKVILKVQYRFFFWGEGKRWPYRQ